MIGQTDGQTDIIHVQMLNVVSQTFLSSSALKSKQIFKMNNKKAFCLVLKISTDAFVSPCFFFGEMESFLKLCRPGCLSVSWHSSFS